jgi:hypothetical protein
MFKPALFKRAPHEPDEPGRSVGRFERLREAGFPARLADTLARDSRYELPALFELTERGCPADLAARIVAPLADDADRS